MNDTSIKLALNVTSNTPQNNWRGCPIVECLPAMLTGSRSDVAHCSRANCPGADRLPRNGSMSRLAVGPDSIMSAPGPLARSLRNSNSWVLCCGVLRSPFTPKPSLLCPCPRRGGGGYPSAEWKEGPWGVFSAVAASSLGVCAVG